MSQKGSTQGKSGTSKLMSTIPERVEEGYERIESFSVRNGDENPGSSSDKNRRSRILLKSTDDRYSVIRISDILWEGFHEMLKRDINSETTERGVEEPNCENYVNMAKGILEKTGSEIRETKIRLSDKNKKALKADIVSDDLDKDLRVTPSMSIFYTSLSGGDVKFDKKILSDKQEFKESTEFAYIPPEKHKFASIDQSKYKPLTCDINKDSYEDWEFKGYYEGSLYMPGESQRRKKEREGNGKKKQNFMCFEGNKNRIYLPFIPEKSEMSLKEFKKRTDDITVEPEELDKTNVLSEASLPMKLIENAGIDFDLLLDMVEDDKYFEIKELGEENNGKGTKIIPYVPGKAYMDMEGDMYEIPKSFVDQYIPRATDKVKILLENRKPNGGILNIYG